MPAEPSYDVFLSHKSEYKPWVEWLGRALQAQERSVFLDIWNLIPGESWAEGLHRGLENCRSALLVATPEVVNSGWIREEYNALQRRRQANPDFRLVPIVFGEFPNLPFLANLQAVDCRDSACYREWFHRILCGLDGKEPGPLPFPSMDLEPPPALTPPSAGDTVPGEERFVQRLMNRVAGANCPPILVASRGSRFQGPVIQALLQRSRIAYGPGSVLHVTPPFSEQIASEDCFAEIARQCGFAEPIGDAISFVATLERQLASAGPRFLLITGFESAGALCRRELAGALRALTERQARSFRVILLGGQRLIEQKYAAGDLSFLSHATVEEWPQPDVEDVLAWQRADFPALPLTRDEVPALMSATGAHPGVLRFCLERWEVETGRPCWQDWAYISPELREVWHRLRSNQDQHRLKELLSRDTLGPAIPWPADETIRALYWADLLSAHGKHLAWRAEVVRQVGWEAIA